MEHKRRRHFRPKELCVGIGGVFQRQLRELNPKKMGHGASSAATAAASSPAPPSARRSDFKENIYFLPLSDFLHHDSFPTYANCSKHLVKITDLHLQRSLIIFISHAWIYHPSQEELEHQEELQRQQRQQQRQSNKSTNSSHHDFESSPAHSPNHSPTAASLTSLHHPPATSSSTFTVDTLTNEKYSLCQIGLQSLHKLLAPDLQCYLWIDSCCTEILNRSTPIENLEDIVQSADFLFTPIPTDQTIPLSLHGTDFLSDYPISLWNRSRYSYLNRDICRWEMFQGASLPLSSHTKLKESLHAGLYEMMKLKKRMHFLYDSNMRRQAFEPFSLPITSKSFQSLLPKLCYSNRSLAAASSAYLVSEKQQTARTLLQKQSQSLSEDGPLVLTNQTKSVLPTSHSEKHAPFMLGRPLPLLAALETESRKTNDNAYECINGYHLRNLENGDQYEGEWLEGECHGPGTLITTSGAVITGTWNHDNISGIARYISPLGEIYEGHWLKNRWHGEGRFTSASGDIYRGEFRDGMMHGDGELISTQTGKNYRGQWRKNQWNGFGELTTVNHMNNEVMKHEGEWCHGVLTGKGVYEKLGVERYDGEWKDGLWNGYGIHTTFENQNPLHVREGYWKQGEFIE
jgi:hypothetical protein